MSDAERLVMEIQGLPPDCIGEVLDFIGYLKQKHSGAEPPDETRARMLRTLEAERQGNLVHTMTIDELEAMTR